MSSSGWEGYITNPSFGMEIGKSREEAVVFNLVTGRPGASDRNKPYSETHLLSLGLELSHMGYLLHL